MTNLNVLEFQSSTSRLQIDDISETCVTASTDVELAIKEIRKLNKAIKRCESAKAKILKSVKEYMTYYGTLRDIDDNILATYKYSAGATRFDAKALEKDNPKLYKKYTVFGEPVRKFLIKEEV